MYSIAISAAAGLCLSIVLTRICRDLFLRFNIVDLPDRVRKLHTQPVPRVGGIAIALSYLGAFAILLLLPLKGASLIRAHLGLVLCVLPALLIVFGTGLIDDIRGLSPKWKLLGQLLAAGGAWCAGVRIGAVGGHGVGDMWSLPLTLLWLLACTNAFNLIDGLDGLAAGVGLFATVTTLCVALIHGDLGLALATAPLAGALIGFLRYNFNPASIFLGDCGSLSIGFLLGCYAVMWSQKSATLLGMTTPIIVLAVPMVDVVLSIIRRFLGKKAIFGADRGHIHHRLLDLGLTPRRAVMIVYCFCALAASVSLIQSTFHNHYSAMFVLLFCVGTCFAIAHLGYAEFRAAGRLIISATFHRDAYAMAKSTFRDQIKMQVSLMNLQTALSQQERHESVDAGC
jgi:UDP-GlcNAc:undecaprenyl-phosphate GlcNAc-1-phosphate transferase